jgi:hypothetical protein
MKSEVKVGNNRLQITRVFDAPRHLVFAFWKEADKVRQWWGCKETSAKWSRKAPWRRWRNSTRCWCGRRREPIGKGSRVGSRPSTRLRWITPQPEKESA